MRYLYHLTDGNKGPVTFEQLQELAKAGTIDNMTPVLAEGAKSWSRWLFIKEAPPAKAISAAAPSPAPAPAKAPAPQAVAKASKEVKPTASPVSAPAAKPTEKPVAKPAPQAQPAPAPAKVADPEKSVQPKEQPTPPAAEANTLPAPEPAARLSRKLALREMLMQLNPLHLIPAAVCAVITLVALCTAGIFTFLEHDAHTQFAELRDMAAEHSQQRGDIEELQARMQQIEAEKSRQKEELAGLQYTLQLTREESARLAKGPYISEAEAKQLKEEQFKAAKLKEQENKH